MAPGETIDGRRAAAGPRAYRAAETALPAVEDAMRAANATSMRADLTDALGGLGGLGGSAGRDRDGDGSTTTTPALRVLPHPSDAGKDASTRTAVERGFEKAVRAASEAHGVNEAAAGKMRALVADVRRAADELRFRGEERRQLAAMASIGAALVEGCEAAAKADEALRAAAKAAAAEAADRVDAIETRLVGERAARNAVAAELARLAAARNRAESGARAGIAEETDDAATTLKMVEMLALPPPPSKTSDATTAADARAAAVVSVPAPAAPAPSIETEALAALAATEADREELARLRDRLERVADDYDRVRRSLAWSEELRADAEAEAASRVEAARADARRATEDANQSAAALSDEKKRVETLESSLSAETEAAEKERANAAAIERRLEDSERGAQTLRASVNDLGRRLVAAEDERDALRAKIAALDALVSPLTSGGHSNDDDLARTLVDPKAREAITAERWRAVAAEDAAALARDEATHWKLAADRAQGQLDRMQSEMVAQLEAQCAALGAEIERERGAIAGAVERASKAERRCAELRRECEEAHTMAAEAEAAAVGSRRAAAAALDAAREEGERAEAAEAAAAAASEAAEAARSESLEWRAALAVVRDQDIAAAVERGVERGSRDRLAHLRLQLGLAVAECARLTRERDDLRDRMTVAEKHVEAAAAFERAAARDARAADEAAFDEKVRRAREEAAEAGRKAVGDAEVRRSVAEAATLEARRELGEARREAAALRTQLDAAEASIAALMAAKTHEEGEEDGEEDGEENGEENGEGGMRSRSRIPAEGTSDAIVPAGPSPPGTLQAQLAAAVRAAVDVVQASARRENAAALDALAEANARLDEAVRAERNAAEGWAAEADAAAAAVAALDASRAKIAALEARLEGVDSADRDFRNRVEAEVGARTASLREALAAKAADMSASFTAMRGREMGHADKEIDHARRVAEANQRSREAALEELDEARAGAAAALERATRAEAEAAEARSAEARAREEGEAATRAADTRVAAATALGLKQVAALQRQLDEARARARDGWLWT